MSPSRDNPTVFLLASTLVTGGAEKVVRALALGLPRHGFDTHVLCLHGVGAEGAELSRLGATVHSGFSRNRFDPTSLFRLSRFMRGGNSAILFTLDHHDAIFLGALASRLAGIRHRILSVHSTGLWAKGGTFSFSDRLVLPLYDRVVALAALHGDYLSKKERIRTDRIVVIHNGIDTGHFRPVSSAVQRRSLREACGIPAESFVVVIVAALRPEKNHEMLLRAAARMKQQGSGALFLIVGEGKEAGKLQSLVNMLQVRNAVRFMGLRKDIPDILALSDASVLCSYPVVETFPLSVLEAMACGIPVVATAVGSIPEMVTDGVEGMLVPPGDVAALSEALGSLESDPERRARMGEAGRKRVEENFTEERMVRRYAELFRGFDTGPGRG
ncbi:MAG: glycosyltransferase [bacterium]|nr:MAG: glycosyltransferase [bacterium]